MRAPIPQPNETFDHYSIRAQRDLFSSVRDPFERMRIVRYAWRQHRGQTVEERLADQAFGDRYSKAEDVCVFAEHDTTDSQGKPRSYRLRDLAQIVRYCNDRAREHQAFAAIADRHTSNPGDPNPAEPRVLGYVGPYRLGLIGDRKPTWAIFCDEYRFPGAAETFQQKNRRSVELWTDRKTGRRWFDPITTCGADAPRLPLPARYSMMRRGGMELERYTVGAPSFSAPSATSTSLKTATPATPPAKQCYAAEDGAITQDPNPGGAPMDGTTNFEQKIGDMSVSDLTDIIMSLPPIQWAMTQMSKPETGPGMDQLSASPSAPTPQGPPPGAPPPAPGGTPGTEPDGDENLGDLEDLLGQENEPPGAGAGPTDDTPPPEEGDDDDKEKNSMSAYSAKTIQDLTKENYSLRKSQNHVVRQLGEATARLQSLERAAADAKRQAKFLEFGSRFPQFPLDDDDRKPALYSMGSNMTDSQFDQYMAGLERHAAKVPILQTQLPRGEAASNPSDIEKEQFAMRAQQRAVELYQMSQGGSNPLVWEQAWENACKELQGT